MSEKKAPLFVRDATGLVRAFGWFDAFWIVSFGFGSSVITSLAFFIAYYPITAPNGRAEIAILIAFPLSLIVYWPNLQMSIAMPRSGGDYVYVSRVIHPLIGFMNSFAFTTAAIIGIGISVPYVVSLGLTAPLYVVGIQTGNAFLSGLANVLAQPWVDFGFGTLIMVVIFLVMTLGSDALKIFNRFQLLIFLAASALLFYSFATYSHSDFIAGINALAPQTGVTVDKIISAAQGAGWQPPQYTLLGALPALPIAMFTYYAASFSSYFAGEVKDIKRTQPIATLFFMVSSLIYWFIMMILVVNMFGDQLWTAFTWVVFGPGAGTPLFPVLMPPQVLMFLFSAPAQLLFNLLLVVNWVQWFVFFWMAAMRSMFAWAFDRVFPQKFAAISDRFKSPIWCGVTVFIFAEIFQYLFIFTTLFTGQFNFLLILSSALIIPNIAAAVFPFRNKQMFDANPRIVSARIAGIPIISILGVLGALIMGWITYIMIGGTLSYALGPANLAAFAFFFAIYGAGIVVFAIAYTIRKRQGVDLAKIFETIPPE